MCKRLQYKETCIMQLWLQSSMNLLSVAILLVTARPQTRHWLYFFAKKQGRQGRCWWLVGLCTSVSLQHSQHTCVQSSQKQTKIFLKLFWCDVFAANLFTFLQSSQNEGLVIVVFSPRKDRALLRTFWKHFNTTTSQWISAEKVFRVYQVYTCRCSYNHEPVNLCRKSLLSL